MLLSDIDTHSGGKLKVIDALPEIGRLLRNCARGPIIMPGSGIGPTSVRLLIAELLPFGLSEVHMSGGEWVLGAAEWKKAGMGMGVTEERAWDIWKSSFEKISAVRCALDSV
jgi:copper homeostasis protein